MTQHLPEIRTTNRQLPSTATRRKRKALEMLRRLAARLRPNRSWFYRVPLYTILLLFAGMLLTDLVIYDEPQPDSFFHQALFWGVMVPLAYLGEAVLWVAIPFIAVGKALLAAVVGLLALAGAAIWMGGIPLLILLVLIAILLKR